MKILIILVLFLVSLPLLAGERVTDFDIDGKLVVLDPTIVPLADGVYDLATAQYCGLLNLRCQNKRFVIKNAEAKTEILLLKKINFEGKVSDFHKSEEMEHEELNIDSTLKLRFRSKVGEKNIKYVFTEIPEKCEKVCTRTSSYCAGEEDQWGNCDFRGEVNTCDDYTTKCTPAYEACMEHTTAPIRLEMIINDVKTEKVAAKFLSSEKTFKNSVKVKMAKCFQ